MKTSSRRAALALASAGLALGLWLFLRQDPAAAPPRDGPRVSWPAGTARTYQVSVEANAQGLSLTPGGAAGASALITRGQLALVGYGESGGRVRVGLKLERLDDASMTLFGAPAMQDAAAVREALLSGEAVLVLLPTGDLEALEFTPGSHNLFRTFAQTIAGELQAPLRSGTDWVLIDATLRGKAEAQYHHEAGVLTRTRARYPRLVGFGVGLSEIHVDGQSRLALSDDGQVLSLASTELLEGVDAKGQRARSRLEVTLTPGAVAQVARPLPLTVDRLKPDQPPAPVDLREQLLVQRIAGLNRAGLMEGLHGFGASGRLPGLGRFMGQASGLLLAHPELCAQVGEAAAQPDVQLSERTLALEVLAAAGSPEAQGAMRTLLQSPPIASDPERRQRYLRLSLLRAPVVETVTFVGGAWNAAAPGPEKRTLSLVLGSTSGALARAGKPAEARPWLDALATALTAAPAEEDRLALTAALGNAGVESHQAAIEAALRAPESSVRAMAINALRKLNNPRAREAVTDALGDVSTRVATQAVLQLGSWGPSAPERAAIITAARQGKVPLGAGHEVLTALEAAAQTPEVRALLEWYLAQEEADPAVQRRARAMLGGAR